MSVVFRVTLEIQMVAMVSGVCFWLVPLKLIALVPIGLYLAVRLLPLFHTLGPAFLVYVIAALALFVDDISQVAWGRDLTPFTEPLGMLLYESFGINGLEAVSVLMFVWLTTNSSTMQRANWWRLGLLPLLAIGSAMFLASFYSLIIGQLQGGSLNTHFIQTRFLHLLPIWTLIGFLAIRTGSQALRLGLIMALLTLFKSIQAIIIYFIARQSVDDEYLVDHYFSMFSVYYIVFVMAAIWLKQLAWGTRILLLTGLPFVFVAFVLNDRRTAYVGMVFGMVLLAAMIPLPWYRRYLGRVLAASAIFLVYVAATWRFEPPIGIIGATFRSIMSESGAEIPSYRELENANLLNAVATAPVLGLGTGREFDERFLMPDISFVYDRYRMIPHNLMLATWSFAGPVGIAAMGLCFSLMIASAGRLIRLGFDPQHRMVAVTSLFFFVQYIVYTYGDLGLQIPRNQLFSGLLFGACWRLMMQSQRSDGS